MVILFHAMTPESTTCQTALGQREIRRKGETEAHFKRNTNGFKKPTGLYLITVSLESL